MSACLSAQQPPQLVLDHAGQPFLGVLQQQAMEVDLGVDLGLLIHQGEREADGVFDAVAAPDTGPEPTMAFSVDEVLLAIARRWGSLGCALNQMRDRN